MIKSFVSLRFKSFLNSLRVHCKRDHPSPSLHTPALPPHTSCLRLCDEGPHFDSKLLTRGCRTQRMMSRIVSSALPSTPEPRSKEIPVSRQSLHSSPHSSRLPMSRPQTWFMKLALPGEKMRQSAWRRSPGCRSFLSQVPVGW